MTEQNKKKIVITLDLSKSIFFALCQECDLPEDCDNKKMRECISKSKGIARRLKKAYKIRSKQ